jgi:hypothetical protein
MDPFQKIAQSVSALEGVRAEAATRLRAAAEAQIVLPRLLSGKATFDALISAVKELSGVAPDDCDVFVRVGSISVLKARFIEPHTFSFEGFNQDGHRAWEVLHFSQLHASVVYLPKRGPSRVITGFSNAPSA